jgi:hypothetical protein
LTSLYVKFYPDNQSHMFEYKPKASLESGDNNYKLNVFRMN